MKTSNPMKTREGRLIMNELALQWAVCSKLACDIALPELSRIDFSTRAHALRLFAERLNCNIQALALERGDITE